MNEKITVPMSKADLLDKLARIMRDRAYPEFGLAAPPLWATDAASTILALFEDLTKLALAAPETTPAGVLRDALWQCGVESGMDTDGDAGPGALIAGRGDAGFAAAMVDEVRRLRLAYDECLSEPAGVLDEAWAAAEKALPEGCVIESVMRVDTSDSEDINDEQWEWEAEASSERGQRSVTATGSTPAAALHALAAALGRSGEPE